MSPMAEPITPDAAPLRVLVVEDEDRYRRLLVDVLPDLGCEAAGARSAAEALRLVANDPPGAILLDLNLPGIDGMTFLERLRRREPGLPVIILTGVGDLRVAQRAIRHGVTDFLTKPCHLGEIEAALGRVRRRRVADAADDDAAEQAPPRPAPERLEDLERAAIVEAVRRHAGNRTAAAASLGISRRTLHARLARYRARGLWPLD